MARSFWKRFSPFPKHQNISGKINSVLLIFFKNPFLPKIRDCLSPELSSFSILITNTTITITCKTTSNTTLFWVFFFSSKNQTFYFLSTPKNKLRKSLTQKQGSQPVVGVLNSVIINSVLAWWNRDFVSKILSTWVTFSAHC